MDGAAERKDGADRMDGAPMDRPIEPPPPPPMDRPIETPPPPPPPPPRPLCWASAPVATTDAVTRHSAPIRRLFVNIGNPCDYAPGRLLQRAGRLSGSPPTHLPSRAPSRVAP